MADKIEGKLKEALAGLALRMRDAVKVDDRIKKQAEGMAVQKGRRMRDYKRILDKTGDDVPEWLADEVQDEIADQTQIDQLRGTYPLQ